MCTTFCSLFKLLFFYNYYYAKFVPKYFMHTRTHILSFFRWQSTVQDFAVVTSKGEHSTDRRFGRHTGTIFFRLPDRPDGNCTWAGRRKRLLQQREAQRKRGAVVAYTDSENSTKTPAPKKQSFDRIDLNDLWNETTYKNARPHVGKVVARPKQSLLYANFKKGPLIGPNCGF